jgi:peptidyl-prolyl cis-trans isomerase B (cyclophilin B)
VATRAALAIGRTMLPGGAAALADHIGDRRPPVRAMSIYGLGLLGLGSDAGSIAQLATSDASGAVRIAALDALERYEAAKALDATAEAAAEHAIAGALAHDSDRIVRGRGAIALFDFASGAQSRAALAALLRAFTVERDAGVRERVMWTIFRGYAKMVPRSVLQRGLRDPDEVVRIEAVRAYGKIDDPDFIYDVEPLAHDPSWRVQEQAMETLRVLKGGKMTEHLSAIPASVHVPPAQPDPFAHLAALPRPSVALGRPSPARADLGAPLLPVSAADMTSPAHGPHPRMRMITTKGNIYIVLYPEWAPLTVENFLNLTARGFYDDNRWFRIVPDFVVQTGEKDDKNAPGPGYTIGAEENPLEQSSYVISMGLDYEGAKAKRDSAGSEYYITISPQYHLDRSFTVFGAVTSGYDVLGRLVESDRVVRIERVSDITL